MADSAAGPQNGLVTQGTIDWTSLSQSIIGFSSSALQRLANADIQPHTVAAASHISSLFRLSDSGRQLVQEAVSTLPYCAGFGNALYFGFGFKHPVRSLSEQDRGQRLLALCGCLASVLSMSDGANVLFSLAQASEVPDELRPSPQQWMNLLKVCGGVLRSTKFSTVAGHFMSLSPDRNLRGSFRAQKAFADVLLALFRISAGQDVSITVVGGRLCGWVAAFGKEILGLEVEIEDDKGSVIYRSTDVGHRVNLHVCYKCDSPPTMCVVSNRTYFIQSFKEIIFDDCYLKAGSVVSGTVQWESCLRWLSDDRFDSALGPDTNFARIVHLAGRIFEGLAKHELSEPFPAGHDIYRVWPAYHPRQYGIGFVQSVVEWLPELGYLKGSTCNVRGLSMDQALREFSALIEQMQPEDNTTFFYKYAFVLTVLFLAWNLSFLQMDQKLEPNHSGLQFLFVYIRIRAKRPMREPVGLPRRSKLPEENYVHASQFVQFLNMGSVYYTAQHLFTLGPRDKYETAFVASSNSGLCFYFDILRDVSDMTEMATTLHVVRGGIETPGGRVFTDVTNITGNVPQGCMWMYGSGENSSTMRAYFPLPEIHKSYYAPQPTSLASFQGSLGELGKDTGTQGMQVHLLVEESSKGLGADLCFHGDKGECRVGVYTFLWELITSTGLASCCHPADLSELAMRNGQVVDSEGLISRHAREHIHKKEVYIFRLSGNKLARCVGLLVKRWSPDHQIILRRAECVTCCINAAQSVTEGFTMLAFAIL